MTSDPDAPRDAPSEGVERRQRRSEDGAGRPGQAATADLDEISDAELAEAREARTKARTKATKSPTRNAVEWVAVIVGAVLIAVVIRTFVFQTFWIPSPSMSTTLVKNDRVLVNKLAYDFHHVNRGDVVVFERPANMPESEIKDLIKRVVGLPGDRVSIQDGVVSIDGRVLDEPYTNGLPTEANVGCGPGDTAGIDTRDGLLVPEGRVLVMGDNRTNSDDGRCFGPIDTDLIVGRAFLIMWPPSKIGGL